MRKKLSRFTALMLALCMLGGCKDTGSGQMPQGVQEDKRTQESGAAADSGEDTEGYVKPEMKGVITVSTFREQEFLTAAAERFQKKYPEVSVDIHVFEGSGKTAVSDYQTYLNTKIMSKKAEDIFFNSFLPVGKYIRMGVFEDLNSYLARSPEFTEENYFLNVLRAAEQEDGRLCLIPYMARFDCIGYSEDFLAAEPRAAAFADRRRAAGFTESIRLAESYVSGTKNAYLVHMNALNVANHLIADQFSRFVDIENGTVSFDGEYAVLLESVAKWEKDDRFGANIADFYREGYSFALVCDYDVQAAYYELDKSSGISGTVCAANEDGKVQINANGCLALNAASEHKELAWEFLKYLLSEEIQSLPSVYGLAVNKAGFEQSVKRNYEFYANGNGDGVRLDEYRALLCEWMEQIGACDMSDAEIWSLIEEENRLFFEGKESAEDAAAHLQRKLAQYFGE